MAIDLADEILQDFLVEASEIIELLGEQLVSLEQFPKDYDLLNAIFRGFHTIKGGAGFLNLHALVDICHQAEDVFNVLRQGERDVEPALMDVILQVVDAVNDMFERVRQGDEPDSAEPALLARLRPFASPAGAGKAEMSGPSAALAGDEPGSEDDDAVGAALQAMVEVSSEQEDTSINSKVKLTEAEFDALLESLDGNDDAAEKMRTISGDGEITDQEFDALLDSLHGVGKHNGRPLNPTLETRIEPCGQGRSDDQSAASTDEINDEEFESLLDDLHGRGMHQGVPARASSVIPPVATLPNEAEPLPPASGSKPEANPAKTVKPTAAIETTVRVDTQRLDEIMNMVGELVLVRNRFETLKASIHDEQMIKAVANLDIVTADLQLAVMKTRMQPIKKVFGRFPRVVRDLARCLKKEVRLELQGEETGLDKNLVEALADPLIHLVRNAVDHGIELPAQRLAAGKRQEGTVLLRASQEGDHIKLTIDDDGQGMDADALRKKVVEKGLMDEESASRLNDKDCYNLIFWPGFSTKDEISDISGRGVGMDVVKTRIAQMNGTIDVDSAPGKGSRIAIKVPLTLAIMPTLMVKLKNQTFALPLSNVVEILDLDLRQVNVVDGQKVVIVRNQALPLFYLEDWLLKERGGLTKPSGKGHVVVVSAGDQHVGFVVDHLVGQEEVVIKALGAKLQGLPGLAGATITGNGMIALILDVPGLVKNYAA